MRKMWVIPIAAVFLAAADLVQALPVTPPTLAAAPGADAMAQVRGHRGRAAAVRGPRGTAVAVRGHRGAAVAVRGPGGRTLVAGRRYHGGIWYGTGRRFWRGRWWAYGVGHCWRSTPIGYVWVCGT